MIGLVFFAALLADSAHQITEGAGARRLHCPHLEAREHGEWGVLHPLDQRQDRQHLHRERRGALLGQFEEGDREHVPGTYSIQLIVHRFDVLILTLNFPSENSSKIILDERAKFF
jgi:hypothetical protein